MTPQTLFFIAGEASGDTHTAHVVHELKKMNPAIRCCGLGGRHMRDAGVEIFFELTKLAAVGLTDVLIKYHKFHKVFHDALARVREIKPDAVILTDFPGFNLRFAREVKKLGIPVIYYISPQVWAWKKDRIHSIPKIVDKMLVILPFEKDIYIDPSMEVEFVGHPLIHQVKASADKDTLKKEFSLSAETVISLLPGSRKAEVAKILPVMAQTACEIKKRIPVAQFVIVKTPNLSQALYDDILQAYNCEYIFIEDRTYDAFAVSDFSLVKSGTSTLEATIAEVPYCLIYKVTLGTYVFARYVIKIAFLGLANIIAGKKIIEEFIQQDADPKKIARHVCETLENPEQLTALKNNLRAVKDILECPNASHKAAQSILVFLEK